MGILYILITIEINGEKSFLKTKLHIW